MKRFSIVALALAIGIAGALLSDSGKADVIGGMTLPDTAAEALKQLNASVAAPTSGTLTQDYSRTPVWRLLKDMDTTPFTVEGEGNYKRLRSTRTYTETRIWKTDIIIGPDYVTYEIVRPETQY